MGRSHDEFDGITGTVLRYERLGDETTSALIGGRVPSRETTGLQRRSRRLKVSLIRELQADALIIR